MLVSSPAPPLSAGCVVTGGSGARVDIRAFNEDSRRSDNNGEGPPPGLLAFSHLRLLLYRHYAKRAPKFSKTVDVKLERRPPTQRTGNMVNIDS